MGRLAAFCAALFLWFYIGLETSTVAGPLTKVHIAKDKDGRQKTYGFVCFKHTESVPYAITLLNGIRLYGRPLNLQYRSGSSHTVDLSTAFPGADNTEYRAPQDSRYRTNLFHCYIEQGEHFPYVPETIQYGTSRCPYNVVILSRLVYEDCKNQYL
ncbi:hypothetical protein scyTo_0014099 [Scyliorhinus torazame]|uniref:RRM domain-containing protein n=1 Tax=Scyliorhinus torazame TaxID=75743 RepID=A0A401NGN1_SCYTO|nr:hypothetical protein [Scyliorhinus torazame]